jgi:hypothetical protein
VENEKLHHGTLKNFLYEECFSIGIQKIAEIKPSNNSAIHQLLATLIDSTDDYWH